jgi:serine/threonine protein kinase
MRLLNNPRICKLLRVYEEEASVIFILERVRGTDLLEYVVRNRNIQEKTAAGIIR